MQTTGRGSQTLIPDYAPLAFCINKPKRQAKEENLYGIGIVDIEVDKTSDPFFAWQCMLERCYDPIKHSNDPRYIGCTVTEEWQRYSTFLAWYTENHVLGYELDKDIIRPGNTVYGPSTAAYVPSYINQCARRRVSLPKAGYHGVRAFAGSFHAQITHKGITLNGDMHNNPLDAHLEWQSMKADCVDDAVSDYLKEPKPLLPVIRSLIRYADTLRANVTARKASTKFEW